MAAPLCEGTPTPSAPAAATTAIRQSHPLTKPTCCPLTRMPSTFQPEVNVADEVRVHQCDASRPAILAPSVTEKTHLTLNGSLKRPAGPSLPVGWPAPTSGEIRLDLRIRTPQQCRYRL